MSEGVVLGHPGLDLACPTPLLSLIMTKLKSLQSPSYASDLQFWYLILLCVVLLPMLQQTEKSCNIFPDISVHTLQLSLPLVSSPQLCHHQLLRCFLYDTSALLLLASSKHILFCHYVS